MGCTKCNSERVASVNAKCSDLGSVEMNGAEIDGHIPDDLNIGGGDYIEFDYCLDCGQIQAEFPLPDTSLDLAKVEKEERRQEFENNKNFDQDEFFK